MKTEHTPLETKLWYAAMESGEFDVVVQNMSDFANDPTAQFNTLLSKQASPIADSRHCGNELDELFDRQSQIVDPHERLKLVNAFERHSLTMAYNIPLLWYQRILVNNKKMKGWDLTPGHFTGKNLVEVGSMNRTGDGSPRTTLAPTLATALGRIGAQASKGLRCSRQEAWKGFH